MSASCLTCLASSSTNTLYQYAGEEFPLLLQASATLKGSLGVIIFFNRESVAELGVLLHTKRSLPLFLTALIDRLS